MSKILVIDDEDILRTEMVDWLTYEDHDVMPAANGLEGVERAIEWHPDLIICDITMPYLDGYGVFLEVHANASTAQTPFIFVTARATHNDIRKGMNLGADDYITKPFTRLQLLEAVKVQLTKFASREQQYHEQLFQLQAALNQEQEQRLLKARLVGMFSHDFRNPLSTILSSKNLLAEHADQLEPERQRRIHNRIDASVKQLVQMLDDMLIVSQIETGHLNIIPESMDVGMLFQEMVQEFQAIAGETHNIIFENRITFYSIADSHLLRQVGSNLISNAIKYSSEGSTVYVSLDADEQRYMLVIQDQGIGISEEDQQKLFEAFHRGNNVGDVTGTGLGLAIVKHALILYGGSIRVESVLNQGTTMLVNFPINLTHPQN